MLSMITLPTIVLVEVYGSLGEISRYQQVVNGLLNVSEGEMKVQASALLTFMNSQNRTKVQRPKLY